MTPDELDRVLEALAAREVQGPADRRELGRLRRCLRNLKRRRFVCCDLCHVPMPELEESAQPEMRVCADCQTRVQAEPIPPTLRSAQ